MSRRVFYPEFLSQIKVDKEDHWILSAFNWRPFNTKTSGPYAAASMKVDGKWKDMLMHRFVTHAPPRTPVEHLNDNGLDNRKTNLLVSNQRSNILRAHPKGSIRKKGRLWRVQMGNKDRGGFATREQAMIHREMLRLAAICRP